MALDTLFAFNSFKTKLFGEPIKQKSGDVLISFPLRHFIEIIWLHRGLDLTAKSEFARR